MWRVPVRRRGPGARRAGDSGRSGRRLAGDIGGGDRCAEQAAAVASPDAARFGWVRRTAQLGEGQAVVLPSVGPRQWTRPDFLSLNPIGFRYGRGDMRPVDSTKWLKLKRSGPPYHLTGSVDHTTRVVRPAKVFLGLIPGIVVNAVLPFVAYTILTGQGWSPLRPSALRRSSP